MAQILDYAWARPAIAQIKQKGYVGVMRYLAPREPDGIINGKVIQAAEYHALAAAGLQIALNWESYANRAREGASAGTADAKEARSQATILGYTGAIYFSVDYDAPEGDQGALNEYFKACAAVLGLQRLGAYGGYWPLKRLFDAGLITFGWQTVAWSGGLKESRAHLFQTGKQDFSGQADIDDVLKENWRGEDAPMDTKAAKQQQAKDVWGTAFPDNTGIHAAWLDAYINHSIVSGPPIAAEFDTVDWSGNPIRCQYFGSGVRIEYYVKAAPGIAAGTNHGYTATGKLW